MRSFRRRSKQGHHAEDESAGGGWRAFRSGGHLAGTLAAQPADFWCPAQGVTYGISLKPAEHVVHVDAVTHQPVPEFQLPVWNALYQVRNFAANVKQVKAFEGVPEWMCDRCDTGDARAGKDRQDHVAAHDVRRSSLRYLQLRHFDERSGAVRLQPRCATRIFQLGRGAGLSSGPARRAGFAAHCGCSAGWRMRDGGVFGVRGAGELAALRRRRGATTAWWIPPR